MDKTLQMMAKRVLNRETKKFLDEIELLMNNEGMENAMIIKKKNENGNIKMDIKPGRTQFKSLMDATGKASCVEELVLFLAYQKAKTNGWDKTCNNGECIAEKIEHSLYTIIKEICALVEKEPEARDMSEDDERILKLMIAEKYMGYLYWRVSTVGR